MTQIDPVYLLKLIEASELMNQIQKEALKNKLPQLSEFDLAELMQVLEKEQQINVKYFTQIAQIEKTSAQKKVRAIYDYAEQKVVFKEEKELAELEEALNTF